MFKLFKYFILCLVFLLFVGTVYIYGGASYGNSRPLTENEKRIAMSIYQNQIDLGKVRLAFGTIYSKDSSKTLGNTVHINTNQWGLDLERKDSTDFDSTNYKYLLIHELGHVWQYQTNGWSYIPKSLIAQGVAWVKTGARSNAYRWQDRLSEGKKWEELNPEEQAESIASYFYYREIGNQASPEQLSLKKQLECFIPLLISTLCKS